VNWLRRRGRERCRRATFVLAVALAGTPPAIAAQGVPEELRRERAEYANWLATAPSSPFRALLQHPIGRSVSLGPASTDIPLTGLGPATLEEKGGTLSLTVAGATRPVWRDRLVSLGSYQLLAQGPPGRTVVTVFGPERKGYAAPEHFPHAPRWRFEVSLDPVKRPTAQRLLAPDGTEVEATEAGTVTVPIGDRRVPLRVLRMPGAGGEESELEIYFQDQTNGRGSYPAGRFVNLSPAGEGRYVLDLNRARNAFCAYNSAYPCPAPWRGNRLPAIVAAGERYAGGGLSNPPQ